MTTKTTLFGKISFELVDQTRGIYSLFMLAAITTLLFVTMYCNYDYGLGFNSNPIIKQVFGWAFVSFDVLAFAIFLNSVKIKLLGGKKAKMYFRFGGYLAFLSFIAALSFYFSATNEVSDNIIKNKIEVLNGQLTDAKEEKADRVKAAKDNLLWADENKSFSTNYNNKSEKHRKIANSISDKILGLSNEIGNLERRLDKRMALYFIIEDITQGYVKASYTSALISIMWVIAMASTPLILITLLSDLADLHRKEEELKNKNNPDFVDSANPSPLQMFFRSCRFRLAEYISMKAAENIYKARLLQHQNLVNINQLNNDTDINSLIDIPLPTPFQPLVENRKISTAARKNKLGKTTTEGVENDTRKTTTGDVENNAKKTTTGGVENNIKKKESSDSENASEKNSGESVIDMIKVEVNGQSVYEPKQKRVSYKLFENMIINKKFSDISVRKIGDNLKEAGYQISNKTISKHLETAANNGLLSTVEGEGRRLGYNYAE